jgi:type VI secretion system secreted protein VgrG
MQERRARGFRLGGAGTLRGIVAGHTYRIEGRDCDAFNGDVLVISTEFELQDVGISAGSDQPFFCRVNFEAQPVEEVFRPPLTAEKNRVCGVQRAIVTGPENQEVWTNEHGCIKLKFEWDRHSSHDENASPWIRVLHLWSGQKYGAMHLPRVGQEVLVDYLGGDPNCPIVIGSLPNQKNLPPWELPAHHAVSGLVSRELSGERNNHLWMDDTRGQIQTSLACGHLNSSLDLGYLKHAPGAPTDNNARGEGFDLRTDGHGTLRATRGLLLQAVKHTASGGHLDREPFIQCLRDARDMAKSLDGQGAQSEALTADLASQEALTEAFTQWHAGANNHKSDTGSGGQPLIGAYAPNGVAIVSATSLTSYAKEHIDVVAALNYQCTAGANYIANAEAGMSLFARSGPWKGIAAQGTMTLHAQQENVEIAAKKDVALAQDGTITLDAKNGIILHCEGAGIRIKGGSVEIFGPTKVQVNTGAFDVMPPRPMA